MRHSLVIAAGSLLVLTASAHAVTAYAVTSQNVLIQFDTDDPSTVNSIGAFTGLQAQESVVGIDFRPSTGQMYALGSASRIYTIDVTTAAASPVGGGFGVALSGAHYGFDFNPLADRIRITSSNNQNLRVHPDTGALVAEDSPLLIAGGASPFVIASAYSNNVAGAASTTLYNLDSRDSRLFTQIPPNDGTQNLVGAISPDIVAASGAGFDIMTIGGVDSAFAVYRAVDPVLGGPLTRLWSVNLSNADTVDLGAVGDGSLVLSSLALAIPAPSSVGLLAILGCVSASRRRR